MIPRGVNLLVIVGPTGSGKSDLAIRVAKQYNGEIICADSRTIYKGLDIGTAKPTDKDLKEVVHWGLDLIEPNERYTAYDYKNYALKKIDEIRKKGKLPIIVGGTGLYIDAVLHDYSFAPLNDELRVKLEKMTLEELVDYCKKYNIMLPKNSKNKRHLISSILRKDSGASMKKSPKVGTLVVGIDINREELKSRLRERAELMLKSNVVKETTDIASRYGWTCEGLTGNIYPIASQYIDKAITTEQFIEEVVVKDAQLAKRQMTWFKRHDYIIWLKPNLAFDYLCSKLDQVK